MGERSIPWSGLKSGAGGPDAGPYSDENWSDIWRKLFTTDRTTEGVIAGYEDELEVSGTSTPVTVAAGAALVDGKFYENYATLASVAINPAVATRIDRIVLRKTWGSQVVRVTHIENTLENGYPPDIEQTDNVEWDIKLAQVSINAAGDIVVIDERTFCKSSLALDREDNVIINGDMEISQRGTTFAAIATNAYSLDRWKYEKTGTMVHAITQDTDVPTFADTGHTSKHSLKIDCTTIDGAIAVGDYCVLMYAVEGYDYFPLVGKTVTFSFKVKATKIGIYCVTFGNSGDDRSYVAEYEVLVTDTWEEKTVTLDLDETGGTWDYTNGIGLQISFALAVGSTFQTTADTWQTGNYLATSNQVNATDNTANNFWLSQVKLEIGNKATDFVSRPYAEELALCQRYCMAWKMEDTITDFFGIGQNISTTNSVLPIPFFVKARTAPTGITVLNAAHFGVTDAAGVSNVLTGMAFNRASRHAVMLVTTIGAANLVAGNATVIGSNNVTALFYTKGSEL